MATRNGKTRQNHQSSDPMAAYLYQNIQSESPDLKQLISNISESDRIQLLTLLGSNQEPTPPTPPTPPQEPIKEEPTPPTPPQEPIKEEPTPPTPPQEPIKEEPTPPTPPQEPIKEEPTPPQDKKPDFIDYLPCKVIGTCLIILEGYRLQHDQPIGLCAIGKVYLQTNGLKVYFGELTRDSLILSDDSMRLPEDTNGIIDYEAVIAIKLEAQKQWCFDYKLELMQQKTSREKQKSQSRKDKQKALADAIAKKQKKS